ncbi:hypothetical protein AWL63_10060 [Sphingomonas panacis]|uniref:Polysaccharide biosynthesis protein C-terminal domain-containing protein n=1 Tax=Sphingomonas panacis TaxID=1560345 RepID=A0A1B3ZA14_9SPHN|nr:oligosaccharide flippase family protein [Sphingomonas panacis]AOH84265.1 hypothetical protein AWL63_10060 [Sphingomonas panacis]
MSNIKLNALALYLNFVVLAVVGLVINPFLVRFLGVDAFGIWKACLRILDLTSVADGRATQALKWIVAREEGSDDHARKQRDIGAAMVIWAIWLPFLLVAIGLTIWSLPSLINGLSPQNILLARLTAALLGLNVLLTALLGVPDAVLAGTNQGYRSYSMTTVFLVCSNLGMVWAAYSGFGIIGLGVATLTGSVLNGSVMWVLARRYVSWWGIKRPHWSDVRRVLGFSNWTLVWSLVQMAMLSSDVLLIGYLRGPGDVGRYTFCSYVAQFALSICLMTGSAVMPRIGNMIGRNDVDAARGLHARAREVLLLILAASACGLLLCNRGFVTKWVGATFYLGDSVNFGMVAVMVQLSLIRFDAQIQDVSLNITRKVVWGLVTLILSLALAALFYWLTASLVGIFIGLIVGRLPLNIVLPRYVAALIPSDGRYWLELAGLFGAMGLAFALSQIWHPQGWIGLLIAGAVAVAISLAISYLFIFSVSTRASARQSFALLKARYL